MRYLALDLGARRTGVAVADDETGLVSPVAVIEQTPGPTLLDRIEIVIDEHGPDALVVGLPLDMDGTSGPAARRAATIAERIAERTGLPVHLQDERLTSFAADGQMARTGRTRGQKKARRDALAAATMLRDFLARIGEDDEDDRRGSDGSPG